MDQNYTQFQKILKQHYAVSILKYCIYVLQKVELVLTNFVEITFSLFFHTIVVACDDNLWQTIYGFFRSWWMSLFNIKCKRLQLCQSSLKR